MIHLLAAAVLNGPSPMLDLRIADTVALGGRDYVRIEGRANEFHWSDQSEASIAELGEGRFAMAWESRRQLRGKSAVLARSFDSLGRPLGAESLANTDSRYAQSRPSVVDGGRVFFESAWGDGSSGGVFVGDRVATERVRGEQMQVVTARAADGRIVSAWVGEVARDTWRAFARVFDSAGRPLTGELQLSREGNASVPTLAVRGESFVVVYQARNATSTQGLFAVRGDLFGQFDAPLRVAGSDAIEPTLVATRSGYALGWVQAIGDRYTVRMRALDQDLRAASPVVPAVGQDGDQNGLALAELPDGRVAMAWNLSVGKDMSVYAQVFDGATAVGSATRITRADEGWQALAQSTGRTRMIADAQGALTLAWSGNGNLGDKNAAHFTRLVPAEMVVAADVAALAEASENTASQLDALAQVDFSKNDQGEVNVVTEAAGPHEPPTFDPRMRVDPWEEESIITADGGFLGISSTGWTPPDPHMCVGPNHVILMTNGAIACFTKGGTKLWQTPIEDSFGFWGSVGATGFVFDPEVIYDHLSGRYIAMAAEGYAPGNRSYALIGISATGDPTGSWHKFRIETTGLAGNLFDSPNIGVDSNVIYVTGDGFGAGSNYPCYTLDKASMLNGNPPAVMRSFTMSTSTQSAGFSAVTTPDAPFVYFIEHREGSNQTSVRLLALRDPLGAPNFVETTLAVASYSAPENVPQGGTSTRITSFDARFWSARYVNGRLWATHHVSNPIRARWYEIAMNGWPNSGQQPSLVQSGDIVPASGVRTSFSSIAADAAGNACVTMARSSTSEFLSMYMARRTAADPLGTMPTAEIMKSATGPYNNSRWGDYSGCEADLFAPGRFWGHHEWAEGNSWRTWVQPYGTTETAVRPTGFTVTHGVHESGGLAELLDSDDLRLVIRQVPGLTPNTPNVGLDVTSAVPANTTTLRVEVESQSSGSPSSNVLYRVDAFNYSQNRWDQVFSGNPTSTDSVVSAPLGAAYIGPNREVAVRARWFDRGTVAPNWRSSTDRVTWYAGQ